MDANWMKTLRLKLQLTQAQMAEGIGLKLRAYQDLESGAATVRGIHINAAHMFALRRAAVADDISLATDEGVNVAVHIAAILMKLKKDGMDVPALLSEDGRH